MGSVMFKCPNTGLAVGTGLQAERSTFARTPVFFSRTLCPHCRAQHEWFAADAWVEDRGRPPSQEAA